MIFLLKEESKYIFLINYKDHIVISKQTKAHQKTTQLNLKVLGEYHFLITVGTSLKNGVTLLIKKT